MLLKKMRTEWRRRHLNPRIKKCMLVATLVGVTATGLISCCQSRQEMADAELAIKEAQNKHSKDIEGYQAKIDRLSEANDRLLEENTNLRSEIEESGREVSRGYSVRNELEVEVTAYTLSENCCNKGTSHPAYGLTADGTNLAGHSLWSARTIAVDPSVIPLGSTVQISFKDESMKKYDGMYVARDTGGAIRGNIIDLFAGDGADDLAIQIGRRRATVKIIN